VTEVASRQFGPVDFDDFHRLELPGLLATRGPLLSESDLAVVQPLAFRLDDGRSYTYVPEERSFVVEAGDKRAHTVVELAAEPWRAFRWELRSSFALLYAEELTVPSGSFGQLVRWEPALRGAFDGQPAYDVDDPPPVLDADGRALDPGLAFTLDEPEDELRDYLERAGYLHLRGVVTPKELEALRSDVTAAVAGARPDDRRSWWTSVGGREVCSRVNYLNEQSDRIAGLGSDERFRRIARLGGPDLRDACDRLDGNGVVIKVPGAGEGLADLPWHRDCGMGGHPVKCPMLNVGIQLDPATAATGQLQMIPGSHRGTSRLPGPRESGRLPVAAITTEPGDVTVHFGHTLHAAPAPSDRKAPGRRALYLSFVPPVTFEMVGPGQGYNDVLFTADAGRVHHVDDLRRRDPAGGRGPRSAD
jgi:Phytanoyl-CoA dioxygenase (PhyH)